MTPHGESFVILRPNYDAFGVDFALVDCSKNEQMWLLLATTKLGWLPARRHQENSPSGLWRALGKRVE